MRLEFAHYDFNSRGTIPAKDFALSMVASADINHINKFLDRADELDQYPDIKSMRVTFEVSSTSFYAIFFILSLSLCIY